MNAPSGNWRSRRLGLRRQPQRPCLERISERSEDGNGSADGARTCAALNHAKLRNLADWQPSLNSLNIRAVDQGINLQDWLRKPQPKQVRDCFAIINLGHFTLTPHQRIEGSQSIARQASGSVRSATFVECLGLKARLARLSFSLSWGSQAALCSPGKTWNLQGFVTIRSCPLCARPTRPIGWRCVGRVPAPNRLEFERPELAPPQPGVGILPLACATHPRTTYAGRYRRSLELAPTCG
jgi:hypothetical protein